MRGDGWQFGVTAKRPETGSEVSGVDLEALQAFGSSDEGAGVPAALPSPPPFEPRPSRQPPIGAPIDSDDTLSAQGNRVASYLPAGWIPLTISEHTEPHRIPKKAERIYLGDPVLKRSR